MLLSKSPFPCPFATCRESVVHKAGARGDECQEGRGMNGLVAVARPWMCGLTGATLGGPRGRPGHRRWAVGLGDSARE